MKTLMTVGILLVIVWVLSLIVFKVAGFLIHLLLIAGVIMVIAGFVKRVSGGSSSTP